MMYGSSQPLGSRVIGHVGGSSLAPRVLGGGLAALGQVETAAASYGSYGGGFAQSYDGQTRSLGFVDDGLAYGNGRGGGGSITVVAGPSGQYSYMPVGAQQIPQQYGSVTPARAVPMGTVAAVQPVSYAQVGGRLVEPQIEYMRAEPEYARVRAVPQQMMYQQEQVGQARILGGGVATMRPQGTPASMSRPVENYAPVQYQSGPEYFSNGTSVVSARVLTREEMASKGHQVGVQRVGNDGGLVIQRAQPAMERAQMATPTAYPMAAQTMVGGFSEPVQMVQEQFIQAPMMMQQAPTVVSAPMQTMAPQVNNAVSTEPGPGQSVCSILPIPADLMMHITEEDLRLLQETTGATIQIQQLPGGTDWEVRLFGSQDVRTTAHQAIENMLNERLSGSPQDQEAETTRMELALTADHVRQLSQDDLEQIKANTGTDINQLEPELDNEGGLTLSFLGSAEGVQVANNMVVDLVNQRMQEAEQQQTQDAGPEVQTMMAGAPPADTMTGPAVQTMVMGGMEQQAMDQQQYAGEAMAPPAAETVLQIPAEYVGFIYEEDLDDIRKNVAVEIAVYAPEVEGGAWKISLTGADDARDAAHRIIQELIELKGQRQAQPEQDQGWQQDQGQMQMEAPPTMVGNAGEAETVPCTILPISYDYLQKIYNLEAIQKITGCVIKVTQPETDDGEWQLMLYGQPTQRQKAHQAIEDTLNHALGGDEDPQNA